MSRSEIVRLLVRCYHAQPHVKAASNALRAVIAAKEVGK